MNTSPRSPIRYLIDEDTSPRLRDGLQRRRWGIDVRVVGGEGAPPRGTKDPDLLDYLERFGYILVSSNRRTMPQHLRDHLAKESHVPGIFILRQGFSYGGILEDLELIWFAGTTEVYRDCITYIPL